MEWERDFDLSFRPVYWAAGDPVAAMLGRVKGERRREMIKKIISGGAAMMATDPLNQRALSEVDPDFLEDNLADPASLGTSVHPSWLGGEYLPDYLEGEVEIVRAVLPDSTLLDVVSIRARPSQSGHIRYRVVDEHGTPLSTDITESDLPLTFGEVIQLITSISAPEDRLYRTLGPDEGYLDQLRQQAEDKGPDEWMTVAMTSLIYPELERYYRSRDQWLADRYNGDDPELDAFNDHSATRSAEAVENQAEAMEREAEVMKPEVEMRVAAQSPFCESIERIVEA